MKHSWKETAIILGWLGIATIAGLLLTPVLIETKPAVSPVPWQFMVAIVVGIGIASFVFWHYAIKNFKKKHVDIIFGFGLAYIATRAITMFTPIDVFLDSTFASTLFRVFLWLGFMWVYVKMVRTMQRSWTATQKLVHYSNAWVLAAIVVAAIYIAMDMSPVAAIIILCIAALYDAWAVWKSKSMVALATYFMERRIFPGIAVPKKEEGKFAVLGGGDVFFIMLIAASLYKFDALLMVAATCGMVAAVVALFLFSTPKRFYPALPFILGGLVVGVAFAGTVKAFGVIV